MVARREYSPEIKAQVMAALLAGQSLSQVAERWAIPEGTVAAWSARNKPTQELASSKKSEIGELVVRCLRGELEMLLKQAEVLGDADWCKKQSASELGVLRGISYDKAIRLLEAFGRSEAETADV
jgi:transposase-like protein